MKHPLANALGIKYMVVLLLLAGDMCPDCAHGTTKTSKRWAKCKHCGRMKIPHMPMKEAAELIEKRLKEAECK
jgi:hypothetical protein